MTGKLRIVAGEYGGRLIACPPAVARPTTDRVREAVFSSLVSLTGGLEGLSVCDAFAGSGALGLEALSRGADRVQLFDADAGALSCLKKNISNLQAAPRAQVERRDVLARGIAGACAPYDLVLLDPPYATEAADVTHLLKRAVQEGQLDSECLVMYERASDASALSDMLGWSIIKQKRYGKTTVDILQRIS